VRKGFAAVERRDFDAMMKSFAPDAVWEAVIGLGTYKGTAEIRGLFEDWFDSYEELEIEPEDVLDLGNGVILTLVHFGGRPVGSTGRVQLRFAVVTASENGLIVRVAYFTDSDEARTAAGCLAEERE